jgi:hypothetical protein
MGIRWCGRDLRRETFEGREITIVPDATIAPLRVV